jgi:hypothetical protein
MNRAYFIILIPALLVAMGYVLVFRLLGMSPSYWRLMLPLIAMGGVMVWFARRAARKTGTGVGP